MVWVFNQLHSAQHQGLYSAGHASQSFDHKTCAHLRVACGRADIRVSNDFPLCDGSLFANLGLLIATRSHCWHILFSILPGATAFALHAELRECRVGVSRGVDPLRLPLTLSFHMSQPAVHTPKLCARRWVCGRLGLRMTKCMSSAASLSRQAGLRTGHWSLRLNIAWQRGSSRNAIPIEISIHPLALCSGNTYRLRRHSQDCITTRCGLRKLCAGRYIQQCLTQCFRSELAGDWRTH